MRFIFACVTVASAIAAKATHGESPRADEITPVPSAVKGIRVRVVSNFAVGEQEPVRIAAHQASPSNLNSLSGKALRRPREPLLAISPAGSRLTDRNALLPGLRNRVLPHKSAH
jgi:hypothetical protein